MKEDITQFGKNVHRNNIWNVILRGTGIILGLVSLKISISYLGANLYGLWATIASVSSWANIGDFGISNGLRNELAKAIAEDDVKKQLSLIKTAEIMLSYLSVGIFFALTIITELLFYTDIMEVSLRVPMYITNAFFCVSFVLGISRTVAYSYQKSWLASLAQTATVAIQIIVVSLLLFLGSAPNLITFATFVGLSIALGNLIIILILLHQLNIIGIHPLQGVYCREYKDVILNIGLQFFMLQICCLILYSTDNVIINKLFDSSLVTKYSVITSVFHTGESLFSLLLISLWSAVTYAATKGDYTWIKKEIDNLRKIWVIYSAGVIIICFLFNSIVRLWLGNDAFYYEPELLFIFGIYTMAMTYGAIYVNVTNGLGRIKTQIICSLIGAVLNIPLSIFLASTWGLGLVGIKLATLLCLFGSILVVPIDIVRYLKEK